MHLALSSLLSLALLTAAQDTSLRAVDEAFCAANIPADLNIVFAPRALFEVSLPQAHRAPLTLHAGVHLPINATAGPPVFRVAGNVGRGPFVVAIVDPDAPTPQSPTFGQIRHFLGGDFVNHGGRLVNGTPAVSDYLQPAPPAGSDPHRYTFLLFKQSDAFAQQQLVNASTSIALFNISQFASAVGLGQPLAGTFMLVGPDA
ncbi:PEBP-like protein [Mycena vulgaris]|nr:PEBP-like protein [Mycena vulgaris]